MKLLKFLETRCSLSDLNITYRNVYTHNVGEVPICYRDVTNKIVQPCRIVASQV